MRNLLLIILALLLLSSKVQAQLILDNNEKLFATAKLWGFMKYYHPNVAKGKFDWDNQLIEILPSIEQATTKEELSSIYLKWIESLGDIELCKKCIQLEDKREYFNKNFDLSWIFNDKLFTNELSEKLIFIEQNRFQGKHYYVAFNGKPPVLRITNEKSYPQFDWTNKTLRLLSLFRYWNIIEYFYPHKYQIDTDWDDVLVQMLPKFGTPNSEIEYHLAMLELVVKIDDSHGFFTTDNLVSHFGEKQIPAAFSIIDNKLIINYLYDDSLAQVNDLKVGDMITKVENVDVGELISQRLKYIYGANNGAKIKYSFNKILNGSSDSIKVEIVRNGQKEVRNLLRYTFDQFHFSTEVRKSWEVMDNNIGYINLGIIDKKDLTQALEELINAQSMILDLRGYPKEFYGHILRNYFGAINTSIARQINADLNYPGKYILTEQNFNKAEPKYKGQVIVLVNERTQSRAEYMALWLQNGYNVTTIGSRTAGAGGIMIDMDFVGGFNSYFTSSGIFYPDMSPIQREGVKIDLIVTPTIEGMINGKDEVLDKAIEITLK
ncbi:S41 family peptidase [Fulvivirga sp.]|uniref:S41 family peptidase n=1 Tax=Fulvivirga sp. TaxID=1931237 RepID=UPI0032EC33C7